MRSAVFQTIFVVAVATGAGCHTGSPVKLTLTLPFHNQPAADTLASADSALLNQAAEPPAQLLSSREAVVQQSVDPVPHPNPPKKSRSTNGVRESDSRGAAVATVSHREIPDQPAPGADTTAGNAMAEEPAPTDQPIHVIASYADDPGSRHRVLKKRPRWLPFPLQRRTDQPVPQTTVATTAGQAADDAASPTETSTKESASPLLAQVVYQQPPVPLANEGRKSAQAEQQGATTEDSTDGESAIRPTADSAVPAETNTDQSAEPSDSTVDPVDDQPAAEQTPRRTVSDAEKDLLYRLNALLREDDRLPHASAPAGTLSPPEKEDSDPTVDAAIMPVELSTGWISSDLQREDQHEQRENQREKSGTTAQPKQAAAVALPDNPAPAAEVQKASALVKPFGKADTTSEQNGVSQQDVSERGAFTGVASEPSQADAQHVQHVSRSTSLSGGVVYPLDIPPVDEVVSEEAIPMKLDGQPLAPVDATLINLPSALAMVGGTHPAVALARWRVQEAYAELDQAEVLWLPSLQAGFSFHRHDGNYQASNGAIVDVNRNSFQFGLGNGATGAGTTTRPGLQANFHLADAIFQPEIARRKAWAHGHAENAVLNRQLLDVALAYLRLLETTQQLRIVEESRARVSDVSSLTENFAAAGEGLQADADRMHTELALIDARIIQAEEEVELASSALIYALSAEVGRPIVPLDATVVPLHLVPADHDRDALIHTGLNSRPELKELQALVAAACERHRRQQTAPFVPSVMLGLSAGGFGGGVGNSLNHVDERYDFDALLTWEVRNLGFGERAARRQSSAQLQQAMFRKVRRMDDVAREISDAHTQVQQRRRRIEVAQRAIRTAEDSYNRNLSRIRDGQGLPLEVLQSVRALEESRLAYADAVVAYNEAQFRLQWALGWKVCGETMS